MQAMINKGYKFKIMPTAEQKKFFLQAFGCARKLHNNYVDTMYNYLESTGYEKGYIPIKKGIPLDSPAAMKKTYPFLKETDSMALCNAQLNFKAAVKKFNKKYDKESYTRNFLKYKLEEQGKQFIKVKKIKVNKKDACTKTCRP